MLYLDEKNISEIGIDWKKTISVIEESVKDLYRDEEKKPIKLDLNDEESHNKANILPVRISGKMDKVGMKWFTSLPDNPSRNIANTHHITILNNSDSGVPASIIDSAMLRIIRSVSVSGLIIKYYRRARKLIKTAIGIIGWGTLGQHHLDMCMDLMGDSISMIYIYDLKGLYNINLSAKDLEKLVITDNWKDVYLNSDIFITCTSSKERYIDIKPITGCLLLNVSLRDYKKEIFPFIKHSIIVDDWEEVCQDDTDIEMFKNECGLNQDMSISIKEIVCEKKMKSFSYDLPIMFCSKGLTIFDIAIASYFYNRAVEAKIGTIL